MFFVTTRVLATQFQTVLLLVVLAWLSLNVPSLVWAETPTFESHFAKETLRLELVQHGSATTQRWELKSVQRNAGWAGNPHSLIQPFPYGQYAVRIVSTDDQQLLFRQGFDTLFGEYATTQKAIDGIEGSFETTVRIPAPKHRVMIHIDQRKKDDSWNSVFQSEWNPSTSPVASVEPPIEARSFSILQSGEPPFHADIVFVAEGYRDNEFEKFESDARRMAEQLLSTKPYSEHRSRFNIHGVHVASQDSGTDFPHRGILRDTFLDSSFNTLDIQRYLLVQSNHRMHRVASAVPYDHVVVLVNSNVYGGGSIRMDYCVTTTDYPTSPTVFVHEFGHGFAYLADEYIGNVTYSDIYPEGLEPPEPNLTRELDPTKIKWRSFLSEGIPLPTPKLKDPSSIETRRVGAFEGGGYLSKGIYRPEQVCWMGQNESKFGFCVGCEFGIVEMIRYYSNRPEPKN